MALGSGPNRLCKGPVVALEWAELRGGLLLIWSSVLYSKKSLDHGKLSVLRCRIE